VPPNLYSFIRGLYIGMSPVPNPGVKISAKPMDFEGNVKKVERK
jgi:hypothetical protein